MSHYNNQFSYQTMRQIIQHTAISTIQQYKLTTCLGARLYATCLHQNTFWKLYNWRTKENNVSRYSLYTKI